MTKKTIISKKKTAAVKQRPVKRPVKSTKKKSVLFNLKAKDGVERPSPKGMDVTFLLIVLILLCVGLIMLLSASAPEANTLKGNSYYFFIRQFAFGMAGFAAMLVISRIDYRLFKPFVKIFMIICLILLTLVLIPGIGVTHNGARRWLKTGFEWQPSEFMKLAIGMFFASMIEDSKKSIKTVKSLVPYIMWLGATALLLMLETHLSGTIIICGIAVTILIVGGAPLKYFLGTAAVVGPLGVILLRFEPGRWGRVMNFLDPFKDTQNVGYQVVQGLYAIATGGMFGLGLGQSVQKYSFLPEPYNDFIFAIICEELGMFGAFAIMLLFAGLVIRGAKIAAEAPDTFGSLVVVGIIAQVAIQTILNIAVATSSIPNTGVALPFFSYGGTSLMVLLAEMGIVLSVSRYSRRGL